MIMKILHTYKPILFIASGLGIMLQAHAATSIVEDFESQTAGSGTPPTGWSLITEAGSPSYTTTAAGQGSDGSGGNAGLAGQVSSTAFVSSNLPGGYLVNSTTFDVTEEITGTFDVFVPQEGGFDDVTFTMGNIGSGITTTAGDSLTVKLIEGGGTNVIADADNTTLTTGATITDDTWFQVAFTWTPTSGQTGNFSTTITNLSTSSVVDTITRSGYTFNPANAQFGFGSVNDTIRFDNVNIQSVPEPSSVILTSLAGLGFILRRNRLS